MLFGGRVNVPGHCGLAHHPQEASRVPGGIFPVPYIDTVAAFTDVDVEQLMADTGIIRHRGKITSTINNARRAVALREKFGSLGAFVWQFEPRPPADNGRQPIPSQTPESKAQSNELRRRGWSFVGPTTVYAFMQAMGLVNDHMTGCAARAQATRARNEFRLPT